MDSRSRPAQVTVNRGDVVLANHTTRPGSLSAATMAQTDDRLMVARILLEPVLPVGRCPPILPPGFRLAARGGDFPRETLDFTTGVFNSIGKTRFD